MKKNLLLIMFCILIQIFCSCKNDKQLPVTNDYGYKIFYFKNEKELCAFLKKEKFLKENFNYKKDWTTYITKNLTNNYSKYLYKSDFEEDFFRCGLGDRFKYFKYIKEGYYISIDEDDKTLSKLCFLKLKELKYKGLDLLNCEVWLDNMLNWPFPFSLDDMLNDKLDDMLNDKIEGEKLLKEMQKEVTILHIDVDESWRVFLDYYGE